ncbi:hypothetical protein M3P05_09235 [Sansalvadorimonas sp. 2012CJ34-2]|uniref:Uncharacterized protein n=1 Tax=Parendozoicomonas callyspongiae TaxID=2942213 RepID=A0ABT0PFL2_9GAMM|nr:hypothetical protein [Sansalvadorimonas sp. 2012CJ34-2]MCL6270115.1 hypothetical protein [Sansalvadorimonas sp. 2012CJ34-2]
MLSRLNLHYGFAGFRQAGSMLLYLFMLLLLIVAQPALSFPKPGTVITVQWWAPGNIILRVTVSEEQAAQLQDVQSAIRPVVAGKITDNYSLSHVEPVLDSGRTHLLKLALLGKGHLHILFTETLSVAPAVAGKSPGGGIAITINRQQEVFEKKYGPRSDFHGGMPNLTESEWVKHPDSGIDIYKILNMHRMLASGNAFVDQVVAFELKDNVLSSGVPEYIDLAFTKAKAALILKTIDQKESDINVENKDLLEQIELLQLEELTAPSAAPPSSIPISSIAFSDLFQAQKRSMTSASGSQGGHAKGELSKNKGRKVASIEETIKNLNPSHPLVKKVNTESLDLMSKSYGQVSVDFISELNALLPGQASLDMKLRNVLWIYFLHAARVVGSNTIEKLPGLGKSGPDKETVEAFFRNPKYKWPSAAGLSVAEDADDGVDVKEMETEAEDHADAMEVVVGRLIAEIEKKNDKGTNNLKAELFSLIQMMFLNHSCELLNEIEVGTAFFAIRLVLINGGKRTPMELRIYKASEDDMDGYEDAIKGVKSYTDKGKWLPVPKPVSTYNGGGVHIQVVSPEYGYYDGSLRTLADRVASREVPIPEAVHFIKHTLDSLSRMHKKKLLISYLGKEQILRKYSDGGLEKIFFVELKPGLMSAEDVEEHEYLIQRDVFQLVKLYYFLRTREDLEKNIATIKVLDGRFVDVGSLGSVFFSNPQDYQNIWRTWVMASSNSHVRVDNADFALLQTFFREKSGWGWNAAEEISFQLMPLHYHFSGQGKRTSGIASGSGVLSAGGPYPHLKTPLDLVDPQKLPKTEFKPIRQKVSRHPYRLTCPKDHPLKMRAVSASHAQYGVGTVCDGCKAGGDETLLRVGDVMSCIQCQYDLCGPCVAGAAKVWALPPEVICPKEHRMKLSLPVGGVKWRICDGCKQDILPCHHYRCEQCYSDFMPGGSSSRVHGTDYCLNCAFWKSLEQAGEKSRTGKTLSVMTIGQKGQRQCQDCNSWWKDSCVLVADDEMVCAPCMAEKLAWFGSKSAKYTPGKPGRSTLD